MSIKLTAVSNIPHIQPNDNLGAIIASALRKGGMELQNGDILAIAQKIISKAEGRLFRLGDVVVSERAREVAVEVDKEPAIVELILSESDEISRKRPGVLVVRHKLGFTSANAGIDRSNVSQNSDAQNSDAQNSDAQNDDDETVLLLPIAPDASAARLRVAMKAEFGADVGVVITDSHGRPFRLGTIGVAIGVAGIPALWDRVGESDLYGYELQHTTVGVADEIAAAAGLLMGQAAEGLPVVLIRGLELPAEDGLASDLVRPKEMDLYR